MTKFDEPPSMVNVRMERWNKEKKERAEQNEKAKIFLQEAIVFYDEKHPDDPIGIQLGKGTLSEEINKLSQIDLHNCRTALYFHKGNTECGPLEGKKRYYLRLILNRKILKRIPGGQYLDQLDQFKQQKSDIEEKIAELTKKVVNAKAKAKEPIKREPEVIEKGDVVTVEVVDETKGVIKEKIEIAKIQKKALENEQQIATKDMEIERLKAELAKAKQEKQQVNLVKNMKEAAAELVKEEKAILDEVEQKVQEKKEKEDSYFEDLMKEINEPK